MNNLTRLAEGLWTQPFPFSVGGCQLGTRSTIVKTDTGLTIISPGPFSKNQVAEIQELGPVVGLVAPNLMHHLFMAEAQKHFPEARVWIASGLEQKRKDLKFDDVLTDESPELWRDEMEQICVPGFPRLNETAFFHKSSRTLILTDLVFNFEAMDHTLTRWVLRMNGALGRFGPSRLLRYFFLQDQAVFSVVLAKILEWDIESVIVAHGKVLQSNGRNALREAYCWLPTIQSH